MNNSKWKIHRVGLINFWYYDEEEFQFLDGRMLLRGANGSGKSVTMQSFIPLLLDGNMRPERLDPFGSRARKMENYLLEEDDEREERTGYLYMELKREEAEQFVTIGIGMRGRKNKKLDSWYFCITDGRRVGKDIQLYKDVQSKIPYTKIELRNRIGEGGRVMDTQTEYMECVNRLLFGFETMDEYKEMLELLIQLRTPKLSKDFKPSIINDILSNSLQTLSEDDLRPLSEAIENMDNMKTNLDTLKGSVRAADAIQKVYGQYNERMLFEKAKGLLNAEKEYEKYRKKEQEIQTNLAEKQEELEKEQTHYRDLEREYQVRDEEKKSLEKNDAVRLKEEEQKLLNQRNAFQEQLKAKEKQEEKKKEDQNTEWNKKKKQEEENEEYWSEIENNLGEMEELMGDVPFDGSQFFVKELKEQRGKEFSFEMYAKELQTYRGKVEDGIAVLQQEQQAAEKYNDVLFTLDHCRENRTLAEKEQMQYENQLHETKEELLEQFYKWEKTNSVLHPAAEIMQEAAKKIDQYRYGSDYSEIRDYFRGEKNRIQDVIREEERDIRQKLKPKKEEKEQLQKDYAEWENKKEPEPERSLQVQANREKLRELQIPYYEFYKTVDFSNKLGEEQAGRIEEALLHMGILDALIIPENYREQILKLDTGLCDKYIFSDVEYVKNNLTEYLEVDNEENNILFYQQISKVLSGIGVYDGETETVPAWLDEQGNYKLGILEGTVTKQYQPKFIGAAARERYKQEKIQEIQKQLAEVEAEILQLNEMLAEAEKKLQVSEEEWNALPKEEDLKIAAKDLAESQRKLENIQKEIAEKEVQLEERRKELEDIRLKVQEVCTRTYLSIRLDVFEETLGILKEYEQLFQKVQNVYVRYLAGMRLLAGYEENLANIEIDLDNIRYDLNRITQQKRKAEESLISVQEQLGLTDYEEIKERLDYCIRRLGELPKEREDVIRQQTDLKNHIEKLMEERDKNTESLSLSEETEKQMRQVFSQEYALNYVELGEADTSEVIPLAQRAVKLLEGQVNGIPLDDMHGKVQGVFHENKGYLIDYNLSIRNLFEELREECALVKQRIARLDIKAKYRGATVSFVELLEKLQKDVEEQEKLLSDKDKELFEDILTNTVSKKIRARIHASRRWVDTMNELMESMQTSSGLRLSLRWKSKRAEKEEQMDTKALVELLQKDVEIMRQDEVEKMSMHFRSKIWEARKQMDDSANVQSFHTIIREIHDYRKWFEFQLECQKTGEKKKELTDRVFFTFSGGEKAMAMYVPLFSAVVAKYSSARKDAPRLISLDEAFAGVDETNIKDMFRLMVEFDFNFMINSQILWGDYETVPAIAIYQLVRPENAKYVSVIPYVWNGKIREMVKKIGDEIET